MPASAWTSSKTIDITEECPEQDSFYVASKTFSTGFTSDTSDPDGTTCGDGSNGLTGGNSVESEIIPEPTIIWSKASNWNTSLYVRTDVEWVGYSWSKTQYTEYTKVLSHVDQTMNLAHYGEHALLDLDNDGTLDLVVGDPWASNTSTYSGALYVYYDILGGTLPRNANTYDLKINGAGYLSRTGAKAATSTWGGYWDLYWTNDDYSANTGAYMMFGGYDYESWPNMSSAGYSSSLSWSADVTYWYEVKWSASPAGDGCTQLGC